MSKKELNKKINEMRKVINLLENNSMLSLPSNVDLSDEQKQQIKTLSTSDIDFKQLGEESPIELEVIIANQPELSSGIKFYIQVTSNDLFQVHISITPELQGLGLGTKIYESFIKIYGHIYSGKGRRFNNKEIPAIYNKLKNVSDIECYENNLGILCVYSGNPDKEELISKFNGN